MPKPSTKKKKIFALIGFIVLIIGLLVFLFSGENFNVLKEIFNANATKEQVQESIGKLGFRAYVVIVVLAMVQVILTFVPAEPLHVISGMAFGLWKGMLLCFIGIIIGNTIIYILYKIFGKKLTDYFATNVEFDFNVAKKSKKIAMIVILLYCMPAIPYGIICFFAASMGMKFYKYILITGVGSIPSLVLDVGLGHLTMSTSWIISIIVFVAILILLLLMYKYKAQLFKKINKMVKAGQEKEKYRVGKYNPFVFNVIGGAVLKAVKFKVKVNLKNNVKKIRKPCIVLCNHGSFYDFVYAGKLLKKQKPHFVVARMYFHNKWLKKILNGTGAFAKSMFEPDIENIKNCQKVIEGKGMLAMMPEARLSTVGKFEGIQDSTYRFIQKMNVAVYVIKINGSYLAKPKWGKGIRKNAVVEAELNPLLKAKEAQTLTIEELKEKVDGALNYDEWQWLDAHPEIKFKNKKIAEGMENVLCICPNCGEKYCLSAKNNELVCEKCNLKVFVDNRYQLSGVQFKNIAKWYEWQTQEFKKQIEKNKDFSLHSKVELRHLSKNGKGCTRHAGWGECTLNGDGLTYVGTQDGEEIKKFFSMDKIYRLLFGAGEDFEIYEGKELYYFVPENKKSAVAWYIVSGLLKK